MKKEEIKKSIKLALILSLFVAGLSFVSAYEYPSSTPPSGDTTVYPLDIGNTYQSKSGTIYIEDNLDTPAEEGNLTADRLYAWDRAYFYDRVVVGVAGIAGTPDLFVKNIVRFRNLGSESLVYPNEELPYTTTGVALCSDETGTLVPCSIEETPIDNTPFFSASTDITIVKTNSGLEDETIIAQCPASHPFILGGGGYCKDGIFNKGMKSSEPVFLAGVGGDSPDGWSVLCNNEDPANEAYAVCSK